MSRDPKRKKDKSFRSFRRACRYLWPHRWTVAISIACALFVGAAFTGGITAMLPIMRVLLNNQTIPEWADSQILADRMGVVFSDESTDVRVVKVKDDGPAEKVGVKKNESLIPDTTSAPERRAMLRQMADPANTTVDIGGKKVALNPVPFYMQWAMAVAHRVPEKPLYAIALAFGLIAIITTVGNVVRFFQEYLSDRTAILAVNDIRRNLYDHVLHVPMSFFGQKGTSDVTSRLVQDAAGLQEGFKLLLGQSVQEPIKVIFAFSLALFLSWKLTLFIVLFGPLMFAIIKKFGKKMRRASREAMLKSAHMLGQIEGTLIGIRVVKAAGAERFERRRYSGIMRGLIGEQMRMSRIDAMSSPIIETLSLTVIGAVVLFASYMVLEQQSLKKTTFFMVMICLGGIGESMRRTSKINNLLEKANVAAERLFETMDLPSEKTRTEEEKTLPRVRVQPLQNEVKFENLTFTYPGASMPALSDVSLTVEKGKSVAVVGRNGSGKTTLLAMLPRFYDPVSGRVTIDGVDIRHVTLKSLRQQISVVTQDSVIFPGTVAENIAYGHPLAHLLASRQPKDVAATRELRAQVESAAKRAFAHEFILEKTNGYDQMLDGLGGGLSGGQKQRLNIARAILHQSPILILDEATSQVDAESEHLIQQAIDSLIHERTTFVIAHRFSTILSADTIVVMERGRIVGQGKHDELLSTCEIYAQLYERQLFAGPTG